MFFVDTNLWVYLFGKEDYPKYLAIKQLVNKVEVVASPQVVNEVCWVLYRKFDYTEKKIKTIIRHFYKLNLQAVNKSILLRASDLRVQYQFSFWDSIFYICENCRSRRSSVSFGAGRPFFVTIASWEKDCLPGYGTSGRGNVWLYNKL
jgi:predicted nucleic acid-binding protein